MRFAACSLVAALTAAAVVAQPFTPELSANSPGSRLPEPQTNAERFAAGLPPLPPTSRRSRAPHGGSRAATARRATVSPGVPVNVKCNILVKEIDGTERGYISPKWVSGAYGTLQSSKAGALEVGFSYTYNDPSSLSQIDLIASNGPNDTYPNFGGISIFGDPTDLEHFSYFYQYVGGTEQSKKGTAEKVGTSMDDMNNTSFESESAIWKYNLSTQEISAQWINSDGTEPATYLVHSDHFLRISGGPDSVRSAKVVTLTCETPNAS